MSFFRKIYSYSFVIRYISGRFANLCSLGFVVVFVTSSLHFVSFDFQINDLIAQTALVCSNDNFVCVHQVT